MIELFYEKYVEFGIGIHEASKASDVENVSLIALNWRKLKSSTNLGIFTIE